MMTHPMIYLRKNPNGSDDSGAAIPVDAISRDEVCTVYIPGNGVNTASQAERLGDIVQKEVFENITGVSNYVVVWHPLDLGDDVTERGIQVDRRGGNIIHELNVRYDVYLSEKNLRNVFRRKIAPVLRAGGIRSFGKMRFALDGDTETITNEFQKLLQQEMAKLGHNSHDIDAMTKHAIANMRPYAECCPEYLDTLFKTIILPRISGDDGARLNAITAATNMRKLNILTHCHGAYVAQMMAEMAENKMHELGYTQSEINQILSQLLVVAFAPACTLEKSKYRFCAFMSMSDSIIEYARNWVEVYAWRHMHDERIRFNKNMPDWESNLPPMVIERNNVSTFMVKRRFDYDNPTDGPNNPVIGEHNNVHYQPLRATKDGLALAALAHNVIVAGIKNSLAQSGDFKPLPPTAELVLDGKNDARLIQIFKQMIASGKRFMADVYKFAAQNVRKIHPRGTDKVTDIKREIIARS